MPQGLRHALSPTACQAEKIRTQFFHGRLNRFGSWDGREVGHVPRLTLRHAVRSVASFYEFVQFPMNGAADSPRLKAGRNRSIRPGSPASNCSSATFRSNSSSPSSPIDHPVGKPISRLCTPAAAMQKLSSVLTRRRWRSRHHSPQDRDEVLLRQAVECELRRQLVGLRWARRGRREAVQNAIQNFAGCLALNVVARIVPGSTSCATSDR